MRRNAVERDMNTRTSAILAALQQFGASVTLKFAANAPGEPEDQLRAPFDALITAVGASMNFNVVAKGESLLKERLGRPDFAILTNGALSGHTELKAPGKGARTERLTGADKRQWERFKSLPNVLYSDGNEWALYRLGERVASPVRLGGDVVADGAGAATADDAAGLEALLHDFLIWTPIVPADAKGLADYLAPLCRLLRREVSDSLLDPTSPLHGVAKDWRDFLFPYADDDRFADAYAQTITFALLLARSEGASTIEDDMYPAIKQLSASHALLSRALQVLTDAAVRTEIAPPLQLLQRVIHAIDPAAMKATPRRDPWLFFYEEFLAAYDPALRKNAGVYYTPVEVVHAQVRLIDDLLRNKLGKANGFAEEGVVTLDPAVGTGTYLLGVIEHALERTATNQGAGAVPGVATLLARQIFGFEIMTGPYAVSDLRVSRAIQDARGTLPPDGPGVYLADTLESPNANPPNYPMMYAAIAEQHERARKVKAGVPVIVCLGNPPYDRHAAADANRAESRAATGGWVRWGDDGNPAKAKLNDFTGPVRRQGKGGQLKNAYNLYVYFWRWALWKVFENDANAGPGVVSFISASSYIDGDAFAGMREWMRQQCDEIWVIDLGGEGRGTHRSDNVFAIQTPVAIAIAVRYGAADTATPAQVHYAAIDGTREMKLEHLDGLRDTAGLKWEPCPSGWQAPFRPAGKGDYFSWPELTQLIPHQRSGVKIGRTWPLAPERDSLAARWKALTGAPVAMRPDLFVNRPTGRSAEDKPAFLAPGTGVHPAIVEVSPTAPLPRIERYGYRSFDRQFIIADARMIDRPGPDVWRAHSDRQVYLSTLLTKTLGGGPGLTASANIPDLDCFSARGAKDILPLYRDASGSDPNVTPGLVELLSSTYGDPVTPEDVFAYAYALLAQPAFTARFDTELQSRELRLPLTKDADAFRAAAELGFGLLWLHTYGERFTSTARPYGVLPPGTARNTVAVPGAPDQYPESFRFDAQANQLIVGSGVFEPVSPAVFDFEVSGLKVVQSWLRYRMRAGKGRTSSQLDDIRPTAWTHQFTTELLELLWVLEATVSGYPRQQLLLEAILAGQLFDAASLPSVPDAARKPPSTSIQGPLL